MKSILKKVMGIALTATLALGMIGCSDGSSDDSSSASSKYAVGDFILKDGTLLSKTATPDADSVAAIIVRADGNGKPALGMGIDVQKRKWCEAGASGYSTFITGLEKENITDGSNGWATLVAACSDLNTADEGTIETVAAKYPAWNFCRKYGADHGLSGTLSTGWYLPIMDEMISIYNNRSTIGDSLVKAGKTALSTGYHWTCCQAPNTATLSYMNALPYLFSNATEIPLAKQDTGTYVCAVKTFN